MLTDFFEKKRKERERLQQKELQKRQLQTVKKVAIGTILGSIAGAVSGVLFAPKSGKETRKDIADAAKNVAGNVKENISDAMDVAKQKADNITREIKSKYSEFVDRNMTELKPESNFKDELQDDEILKEEVEEIIEEVKDNKQRDRKSVV